MLQMEQDKKPTDLGAMIGVIIVIILLVTGAFYFAGERIKKSNEFKASIQQAEATTTSTSTEKINSMGTGTSKL
jgi:hypothetical protein